MKYEFKIHLIELMNDMAQQIEIAKNIARDACSEGEFNKHRERIDEVLVHITNAKNHVLDAGTDTGQTDTSD